MPQSKLFRLPRRGEIWWVDLRADVRGSEPNKIRPSIVMSLDFIHLLTTKVILPITGHQTHHNRWDWLVEIPASRSSGLEKTSTVDASMLNSADLSRFKGFIGTLERDLLEVVEDAVRTVL